MQRARANDWSPRGTALRSSPGPETGCSTWPRMPSRAQAGGCDPHPVRRPGAASARGRRVATPPVLRSSPGPETGCSIEELIEDGQVNVGVAILTRSGDRVQPWPRMPSRAQAGGCDPHPVRRPGAAWCDGYVRADVCSCCDPHPVRRPGAARSPDQHRYGWTCGCDPHPVRRPGAAPNSAPISGPNEALRSSPGPETGCSGVVPVLTHRPLRGCDPHPVRRPGAARTQYQDHPARARCCDPHPVRRPGAADPWSTAQPAPRRCDPHPVRRPGAASARACSDRGAAPLRSSPGPETGCSSARAARSRSGPVLRSSPGPETGCSAQAADQLRPAAPVAILTRSGDRVQHLIDAGGL